MSEAFLPLSSVESCDHHSQYRQFLSFLFPELCGISVAVSQGAVTSD
jgi:hypothetical protein